MTSSLVGPNIFISTSFSEALRLSVSPQHKISGNVTVLHRTYCNVLLFGQWTGEQRIVNEMPAGISLHSTVRMERETCPSSSLPLTIVHELRIFRKSVEKIQVLLKSETNSRCVGL